VVGVVLHKKVKEGIVVDNEQQLSKKSSDDMRVKREWRKFYETESVKLDNEK